MIYLDSSYIIKCYLDEPGSAEVLDLVRRSQGRSSSLHARSEFWSGVHRHLRERNISLRQAHRVWQQLEQDENDGIWNWLTLTETVVRRACRAFEQLKSDVYLRSGDALHLACAAENGFAEIFSGDRVLLMAAPHFGLRGINVY